MQAPNLTQLISLLGLTEEEAKLMSALSQRKSLTAPMAARILGKPRSRAYEVLRHLVEEGFVVEEPGRPLRYHPRPIWEAVSVKRRELAERMDALRDTAAHLDEDRSVARPGPVQSPGVVGLYWGVVATNKESARIISNARQAVVMAGCQGSADSAGFAEIRSALESAIERGVSVRVYLPHEPTANACRDALATIVGPNRVIPYRPDEFPDMTLVSADASAMYCFPTTEFERGAAGNVMGVLFRGTSMPEFTRRGIQALLHPLLAEPVDVHAAGSAFNAYREAVAAATTSITILAGRGWSRMRTRKEAAGLFDLFKDACARGIHMRILLDNDAVELVFLEGWDAPSVFEVRIGRWLPAWTAIVDERIVFMGVGKPSTGLFMRQSVDRAEVQWYLKVFERVWAPGRPLLPTMRPKRQVAPDELA